MMELHWPGFDSLQRLSPDEAREFAAHVAELSKAGLPLSVGLRALADETPSRRLAATLYRMADRLESGENLTSVLESHESRLPQQLRGVMLAGIRTGRLAEALGQYLDMQQEQSALRRRLWTSLAYPIFLLVFITLISAFLSYNVVINFAKIFKDFGTELPTMTHVVIHCSKSFTWCLLGFLGLLVIIPCLFRLDAKLPWVWVLLYKIPMLGPQLRCAHLAYFSQLMGLLLDQQVALPDALRLTAAGLGSNYLATGCHTMAREVEQGRPFVESIASHRQFPMSLIAMLQWGQQASTLPDAFLAASETFSRRARMQGTLLESLLLPMMFFGIMFFIGFIVIALFLPLVALVQKLS